MDERLFINLSPGPTYLDRLTGKTKVRLFFAMVILLIATWDMRIIFPCLIVSLLALYSLRAKLKSVKALTGLKKLENLRVNRTNISDISYFGDFAALKKLDIAKCPILLSHMVLFLPQFLSECNPCQDF